MGSDANKRDFSRTLAAISEHRATQAKRSSAWNSIETKEDVDACVAADAAALRLVQDAFYEDTKDINRQENCWRIDLADIIYMTGWRP